MLTPAEKQVLRNKELISNREQMLFRLKRELELEGGLVTPRTRKRMMQQITSLTKEIKICVQNLLINACVRSFKFFFTGIVSCKDSVELTFLSYF